MDDIANVAVHVDSFMSMRREKKLPHTNPVIQHYVLNVAQHSLYTERERKESTNPDYIDQVALMIASKNFIEEIGSLLNEVLDEVLLTRLKTPDNAVNERQKDLLRYIFHFLNNFSDESYEFCKVLLNTKSVFTGLSRIQRDWRAPHFDQSLCKEAVSILNSSMTPAYNCLTHDVPEVAVRLQEYGIIDVLKPYLQSSLQDLRLNALLTFAYACNEEEAELILCDPPSMDFIMQKVIKASGKNLKTAGYSLQELILGIVRLAKNVKNRQILIENHLLETIQTLLSQTFSDPTIHVECYNLLWTLSFDSATCSAIVSLFPNLAEKLSTSVEDTSKMANKPHKVYRNRDPVVLQMRQNRAIQGVLWNQKQSCSRVVNVGPNSNTHIMISYQWAFKNVIYEIVNHLTAQKYTIWFDERSMLENTLEDMAKGIENAALVIVCYSSTYKNSQNCQSEAQYAYKLDKPIIPVRVERDYRPDGWLGIMLGTRLYYDFSGKYPFEVQIPKLITAVESALKSNGHEEEILPTRSHILQSLPRKAENSSSTSVKELSPVEIEQWYNKHQLKIPSLQDLPPKRLMFLREIQTIAPEYFFTVVRDDLQVKKLDDVIELYNAMKLLP